MRFEIGLVAVLMTASPASAQTAVSPAAAPTPVVTTAVDLTDPARVAELVREIGYKAELKKNDRGEPYVSSAANGSSFSIDFYGCTNGKCNSIQFYAWYKKKPGYDIALANRWNASKRFIKAAIDKDGDLATYMDVTALGGTRESFADSFDWWTVMTSDLFDFLEAEEAKAPVKAPAS